MRPAKPKKKASIVGGQLALLGGKPAITADAREKWRRPVAAEKKAVCRLLDSGQISGAGAGLPREFEEQFREFIGCQYVLSVSHGHLALASAFFAAGLGRGDEFIVPTFGGYIGSYAGALHMGATPVFCEPDPRTLLADPDDIARRITPKTRVISPIHRNGCVCDLDRLLALCKKHALVLVEDAAHAHGSTWGGVKIGNLGHIACFSMQGIDPGNKPVTSGEGGLVATNDRELYERCLIYCHLHRGGLGEELTNPVYRQLEAQVLGWKWRAHPLGLAVAQVSLKTLPERLKKYAANRDELFSRIRGLPGIEPAAVYPKAGGVELYGGMVFRYDPDALGGLDADRFCEALQAEGLPMRSRGVRAPEHLRSLYTRDLPGLWGRGHVGPADMPLPRHRAGDYPLAERLFNEKRTLSLAGWIECAAGLVAQAAEAIRKVVDRHRDLR